MYPFRRGAAIIINNWKFKSNEDSMCHDIDMETLRTTLPMLSFDLLEVGENLDANEILPFMRKYAVGSILHDYAMRSWL